MRYGKPGHYGWPNFPDTKNVGGDFYLDGFETTYGISPLGEVWKTAMDHWQERYKGNIVTQVNHAPLGGTYSPDSYGPSAYARMKPTQPSFSASVAIAELRELPKAVWQLREGLSNLKELSNWWLALQFGWKPLLMDIFSIVDLQRKQQKIINQLLRDNGKPVRRRIVLADNMSNPTITEGENWGYFYPGFTTGYMKSNPKFRQSEYTREIVWASARFRYWLPPGTPDVIYRQKLLRGLYGLNIAPSTVWNLMPWSWLADWFTTVGDSLENLEAGVADRLAADYFYVMMKASRVIERSSNYEFADKWGNPVKTHGTARSEGFHKIRGVGDPFGWRINESSLSGMQLSILGALGMSRLR